MLIVFHVWWIFVLYFIFALNSSSHGWFPPRRWHLSSWVTKFGHLKFITQSLLPKHSHHLRAFGCKLIIFYKKVLLVFVILIKVIAVNLWSMAIKTEKSYIIWRNLNEGNFGLKPSFKKEKTKVLSTRHYRIYVSQTEKLTSGVW